MKNKYDHFENERIRCGIIVLDNQKAAKGEAVFRYYSNGEEEILNQILKEYHNRTRTFGS